jgi:hypothetical protein
MGSNRSFFYSASRRSLFRPNGVFAKPRFDPYFPLQFFLHRVQKAELQLSLADGVRLLMHVAELDP